MPVCSGPTIVVGQLQDTILLVYLYHNSTLALNADPARPAGTNQHLNDDWNLDPSFERPLVDIAVAPNPTPSRDLNPASSRATSGG